MIKEKQNFVDDDDPELAEGEDIQEENIEELDFEEALCKGLEYYEFTERDEDEDPRNDRKKTFRYLNHACSLGNNAEAAYKLAMCYIRKWGVDINHEKAFELFTRSAELGYAKANWKLAIYYEGNGGVVDQNLDKAEELLLIAANAGIVEAQRRLGDFYIRNKRIEDSVKWLRKAILAGDKPAQDILARHCISQVEVDDPNIFVTPNIEENTLECISLHYAMPFGLDSDGKMWTHFSNRDGVVKNSLVFIVDKDSTGIKSGLLITTRAVYSQEKSFFKTIQHQAALDQSTKITTNANAIYVNDEKFFEFSKASMDEVNKVVDSIKKYQDLLK